MKGWRCTECGEVRWSLTTGVHVDPEECPVCAGALRPERRFPGRAGHGTPPSGERRHLGAHGAGFTPPHPPQHL